MRLRLRLRVRVAGKRALCGCVTRVMYQYLSGRISLAINFRNEPALITHWVLVGSVGSACRCCCCCCCRCSCCCWNPIVGSFHCTSARRVRVAVFTGNYCMCDAIALCTCCEIAGRMGWFQSHIHRYQQPMLNMWNYTYTSDLIVVWGKRVSVHAGWKHAQRNIKSSIAAN